MPIQRERELNGDVTSSFIEVIRASVPPSIRRGEIRYHAPMALLDPQEKAALRAKEGLRAGTWSFALRGMPEHKGRVLLVAVLIGLVVGVAFVLLAFRPQ
jgi:hypothetical protein